MKDVLVHTDYTVHITKDWWSDSDCDMWTEMTVLDRAAWKGEALLLDLVNLSLVGDDFSWKYVSEVGGNRPWDRFLPWHLCLVCLVRASNISPQTKNLWIKCQRLWGGRGDQSVLNIKKIKWKMKLNEIIYLVMSRLHINIELFYIWLSHQ